MEVAQPAARKKTCADKLFMLEDKFLKNAGLYALFCTIFFINIIVLSLDDTTGSARDFNVVSSILSTIYPFVSTITNVHGVNKPSFMLVTAGPVHQYSTWILLAYHRGNVFGSNPLGVMNSVYTFVVAVFSIDMFIKTWYSTLRTDDFVAYLKDKDN